MKVYIVVKETLDYNTEIVIRQEYVDCFINADDALNCVNEITTTNNERIKVLTKEFGSAILPTDSPFVGGHYGLAHICKNWSDCTNPLRDCINCPIRGQQDYYTVSWTGNTQTINTPIKKSKKKNENK